jgi:hypothetical protein
MPLDGNIGERLLKIPTAHPSWVSPMPQLKRE